MQITINIDPNLPRWLKRVAMYAGVPAVLVVATAVYADVTIQPFGTGDALSSTKMNENFNNLKAATDANTQAIAGLQTAVPPGTILAFAGAECPAGFLEPDGTPRSKASYPTLSAALKTTWGAGDASSFSMPDLRGAFLRGTGSQIHAGVTYSGAIVGTKQADMFQDHKHAIGTGYYEGASLGGGIAGTSLHPSDTKETLPVQTGRYGAETRPFNAGVHFCVKY